MAAEARRLFIANTFLNDEPFIVGLKFSPLVAVSPALQG
jgi:hypothetical protein